MAEHNSTIDAVRKAFSSQENVSRIESALQAVGEGIKDADADDTSTAAKKIAAAKRRRAANKARKAKK